jgi:hypothetical protein
VATLADLPASYKLLAPAGGNAFEGDWDAEGRRHAGRILLPWEDAEAGMQAIAGVPTVLSGALVRRVPLESPYVPGMYATSLRHRGVGVDGAITPSRPYSHVMVDVVFETPRWPLEGSSAYTSFRFTGNVQRITLPNTYYTFAGQAGALAVVEQNVGRDVGAVGVEIGRHWVADPTISMAVLLPLLGKVSTQPVTIGALTFAAGTLLFPTTMSDIRIPAQGEINATLALTLSWRELPWNMAIRPDGAANLLSPLPFATADLNAIFAA